MEIIIGTFDVKYDGGRKYKIVYHKGIKNKDNHDYKDIIIKNIYRILMTRGMKWCYTFCVDKNLNEYIKKNISKKGR